MNETKNNLSVPIAIVIAGLLIAGAMFFGGSNDSRSSDSVAAGDTQENNGPSEAASLDSMNPITEEDHILGDPNAPVKIVEYSDFECPFCKRFHGTMNQIMDEYGESGQVAWVYRQFPLEQLHPVKAVAEAVASECVAEIGGNGAFWQFADRFFELSPSNNQTDIETVIPQIIDEIGIDMDSFQECVNSGRYNQHVEDDVENAFATGGRGTPWSIVVGPNGEKFPLNGAQPYTAVKQLVDTALNL